MRYEEPVFRPPSEADSLLIQATIGCPHNRCRFCSMYKMKKFRVRPVAEIKEDLDGALAAYGDGVDKIFFPDGNTIFMKTAELCEVLEHARSLFPSLGRMTVYGAAKFVLKKSPEELTRLKEAGLTRIHMGLETGHEGTLRAICKGATAAEQVEAGRRVKDAGIHLSEYVLIGIAGAEMSEAHAVATADVLNRIDPDFIRLRTYVPVRGCPVHEDYEAGRFRLITPHEALKETRVLVENLEVTSLLFSDHVSNYVNVQGQMPRDKKGMLRKIDEAMKFDESDFRPRIISNL
jgi:radical SAM superfamily enzyme YgiQ (UPF0313 family)